MNEDLAAGCRTLRRVPKNRWINLVIHQDFRCWVSLSRTKLPIDRRSFCSPPVPGLTYRNVLYDTPSAGAVKAQVAENREAVKGSYQQASSGLEVWRRPLLPNWFGLR